jgi:hypothetical protein
MTRSASGESPKPWSKSLQSVIICEQPDFNQVIPAERAPLENGQVLLDVDPQMLPAALITTGLPTPERIPTPAGDTTRHPLPSLSPLRQAREV